MKILKKNLRGSLSRNVNNSNFVVSVAVNKKFIAEGVTVPISLSALLFKGWQADRELYLTILGTGDLQCPFLIVLKEIKW